MDKAIFTPGQKIVQFIITELGSMGMIEGTVKAVNTDSLTYTDDNSNEHIVPIEMWETIM